MRSESWWFCASLSLPADATLRILPRNGSTACEARSRACFAEPPAESPSTMKISEPWVAVLVQSASLPGSRSLRTALLRKFSFSWRRRMRSSARSTTKSSSLLACVGLPASQWANGSRIAVFARRGGPAGRQPILGLALEFRLADEYGNHAGCAVHYVVACDRRRALALTHSLGM